jgi:hypothetical protein
VGAEMSARCGSDLLWWVWTCPNAVALAESAVLTGHSKSRSNSVRTSPDPRELPTGRRALTHHSDSHPIHSIRTSDTRDLVHNAEPKSAVLAAHIWTEKLL